MKKFKTTIKFTDNTTVEEETKHLNKKDCLDYWINNFQYWGKVQRMWQSAEVVNIEEIE